MRFATAADSGPDVGQMWPEPDPASGPPAWHQVRAGSGPELSQGQRSPRVRGHRCCENTDLYKTAEQRQSNGILHV